VRCLTGFRGCTRVIIWLDFVLPGEEFVAETRSIFVAPYGTDVYFWWNHHVSFSAWTWSELKGVSRPDEGRGMPGRAHGSLFEGKELARVHSRVTRDARMLFF
jgi:hypothetical protein